MEISLINHIACIVGKQLVEHDTILKISLFLSVLNWDWLQTPPFLFLISFLARSCLEKGEMLKLSAL